MYEIDETIAVKIPREYSHAAFVHEAEITTDWRDMVPAHAYFKASYASQRANSFPFALREPWYLGPAAAKSPVITIARTRSSSNCFHPSIKELDDEQCRPEIS